MTSTKRVPQKSAPPRTAAATAAATAKRQLAADTRTAERLAARGWACFSPAQRQYLEDFMAAHKGDACPPAGKEEAK